MDKQRKLGSVLAFINIFAKNGIYILYTPFLIHFIGQSSYGIFQLTTQITSTLSLLALGFSGAYVHFYWVEKKKSETNVSRLNAVYLIIFSGVSIVSLIIGYFLVDNVDTFFGSSFSPEEIGITKVLMIIMVINASINFISTIFDSYIIAHQQFIFQQIRILVSMLIQPFIVIPLIIFGFGVISVVLVQVVVAMSLMIINGVYAVRTLNMKFDFHLKNNETIKPLFIFSLFLLGNDLVDIINNNIPGMLVGSLRGPEEAAVYAVVIQLRTIFFQFSLAISTMYVSQINELITKRTDNRILLKKMISIGRTQFILLLFVLGAFVIGGRYFISMWAGPGFDEVYTLLLLTVVPVLVPLSQNVGIEIQRAKNLHKFRSISLLIVAIINIMITYFFLKNYNGIIGAFAGYIFSIVVGNGILINLYNHFVVGLDMVAYWKNVLPMIIPAGIAVLIGEIISSIWPISGWIAFIAQLIVYSVVFIVVWYAFIAREFEKQFISKILYRFQSR